MTKHQIWARNRANIFPNLIFRRQKLFLYKIQERLLIQLVEKIELAKTVSAILSSYDPIKMDLDKKKNNARDIYNICTTTLLLKLR